VIRRVRDSTDAVKHRRSVAHLKLAMDPVTTMDTKLDVMKGRSAALA